MAPLRRRSRGQRPCRCHAGWQRWRRVPNALHRGQRLGRPTCAAGATDSSLSRARTPPWSSSICRRTSSPTRDALASTTRTRPSDPASRAWSGFSRLLASLASPWPTVARIAMALTSVMTLWEPMTRATPSTRASRRSLGRSSWTSGRSAPLPPRHWRRSCEPEAWSASCSVASSPTCASLPPPRRPSTASSACASLRTHALASPRSGMTRPCL
mmetsp:Transcript_47840/g.147819  ORF Transcript_47840/g.147819 Transcript_47840/m.147819 type:complete len:214 (-) Transcript_47840:343-984(-)